MRRRMGRVCVAIAVGSLFVTSLTTKLSAQADAPRKFEAKAETSRGGADAPKASAAELNKAGPSKTFVRPPSKGGARERGAAWHLFTFDNYTGYWVDCFYNSQFGGTLAPYGALTVTVSSGAVLLHCLAPGTNQRWGPRTETVTSDAVFALYE